MWGCSAGSAGTIAPRSPTPSTDSASTISPIGRSTSCRAASGSGRSWPRGLAQEADVVLLDEPLTGLDVVSRSIIADAIERVTDGGGTTITTTHSFAEAEQCDLVLLLATRSIAFGPPEAVLVEPNLREAFGGRYVRVGETLIVDDPHHDHVHAR